MTAPQLEFAFEVRVQVGPPLDVGPVPGGRRRIVQILNGTFEGSGMKGRVLPGGADWQIIRSDGAADIKARYTIETGAGALIMVTSEGLRHGPPDVMEKLARGDNVDPRHYYFRTVMRFETAAPAVDWLNRILAVAKGQREPNAVRLDVYEVE